MFESLLKPGTIVSCRSDTDNLVVWRSYRCDVHADVDCVKPGDIMLVLKVRKLSKRERDRNYASLNSEWEKGAYKVLTPSGAIGWIGAGWVISLNN